MRPWQLRQALNWINLSTPLGLVVAYLGKATIRNGERGTFIATGYAADFPVASAFTIGSVVITTHPEGWFGDRPRELAHEERHAWQYVFCLGVPLLPLYALAMAYSQWRTGDPAAANVFELGAGLADGNYRVPTRDEIAAVHARRRARVRSFLSG
jgi:hypothetical protein